MVNPVMSGATKALIFSQKCNFLISAASVDQFPETKLPEIAFAGRSNVGKSSLINALTNRKNLARTSNTPGRTQQINFFELKPYLMLVDLPGYGYARARKSVVDEWTELVRVYIKGRAQLQRVCLLVDSRHGLKKSDTDTMDILDSAGVNYQLVLTKSDKLKKGQLKLTIEEALNKISKRPAAHPEIVPTSSVKFEGIVLLRSCLKSLL